MFVVGWYPWEVRQGAWGIPGEVGHWAALPGGWILSWPLSASPFLQFSVYQEVKDSLWCRHRTRHGTKELSETTNHSKSCLKSLCQGFCQWDKKITPSGMWLVICSFLKKKKGTHSSNFFPMHKWGASFFPMTKALASNKTPSPRAQSLHGILHEILRKHHSSLLFLWERSHCNMIWTRLQHNIKAINYV